VALQSAGQFDAQNPDSRSASATRKPRATIPSRRRRLYP